MPLMQDCPPLLIISKAGYYWSIVAHSTSPWLVFLASVQQGRALKFAFAALKSIKYTLLHLPEVYRKPPEYRCIYNYSRHATVVVLMVSTLERFLQSFLEKEFYLES